MTISCTQTSGFLIEDPNWLGRSICILQSSADPDIRAIAERLDAIRGDVYYKSVRHAVEIDLAEVLK